MLNSNDVSTVTATQYVGMTYDTTEIAMPNGAPVPIATTAPPVPRASSGTSVPAATAPASITPEERLSALKQLLDQKLIIREEYEARRKAILDSL
jgi:hypothetical protein